MRVTKTIVLGALLTVILFVFLYQRTEHLKGESEVITYVRTSESPNPFIVYGMVKKLTNDEEKQKRALRMANQGQKRRLIKFLKTL
tara:strand:+ start:365 stop:622 length:258 start_codon:yes stop_codon:yes gene_type:complete